MSAAFVNPRLIEVILGLVLCEAVALLWLRHHGGWGPAPAAVIPTLLSGAFLLLALRAALAGGGREMVAVWLAAALVAHVVDLGSRWRK